MHKNWKSILVTYGQLDKANIQKWHMENLLIFLKDTFSLCPPKQEWKSGQDLIICQITCRVSPHRCKSSHSHHRLLICCGLSALLCTIISAYHCSLLPGLQHTLCLLDYRSCFNPLLVSPEPFCACYQLSRADNGVTYSFPFWCSVIQAVVQVFTSQAFWYSTFIL